MRASRPDHDHVRRPESSTERAAVQRAPAVAGRATIHDFEASLGASPVQLRAFDASIGALQRSIADVHAAAARGTSGGGGPLPHQERIQAAFGRHDVSDVRAHQGGAAAEASRAMGARAYASGNDVAFGGAPDLFTAAHEAAHVVQQRGGVQLAGGVGRSGDAYEQHADRVAAEVVRGGSAEALLDGGPQGGARGGGAGPATIQKDEDPAAADKQGEPNPDFEALARAAGKTAAIAAVNALVAQGYTPEQIAAYAEQRAAADSGWKRTWANLQAGRWIVVHNDDGTESWSLSSNAKDGLTWANARTRVSANIVGEGGKASVSHKGDKTSVVVDAAGGAHGQAGGQGSARVKVSDNDSGEHLTIGATYKGDGSAHDGQIDVNVGDGKRSIDTSAGGGTDAKGRPQARVRGRYKAPDLTAGGGANLDGDGHVKGDASVETGGVSGELSGGHGGGRTSVEAKSTFKAGDKVKVSLAGSYYQNEGGKGGKGNAAIDVDGLMKGAGFEYANTKNGAVSVHTATLNGGTWDLGGDQKLGVKGTITIPDGEATTWRVESELVIVPGGDQITIKGKFGDAKINDLSEVVKHAPEHAMAHALFSVAAGRGDVKGSASAIVAVSEDEMLLGLGGQITIGGRTNGQHDIKFLYNALGSDKFRHYAELAYTYLKQDFKVGASGSIDVKPTDKGYEKLYKLQTSVGFSVAPGHSLRFDFGLAQGKHLAFTAGAEWDWEGVMKVSLKSEFNLDDSEDLSFLLRITPSTSDRFEIYFGYRTDHKIGGYGAYDAENTDSITGGFGGKF